MVGGSKGLSSLNHGQQRQPSHMKYLVQATWCSKTKHWLTGNCRLNQRSPQDVSSAEQRSGVEWGGGGWPQIRPDDGRAPTEIFCSTHFLGTRTFVENCMHGSPQCLANNKQHAPMFLVAVETAQQYCSLSCTVVKRPTKPTMVQFQSSSYGFLPFHGEIKSDGVIKDNTHKVEK